MVAERGEHSDGNRGIPLLKPNNKNREAEMLPDFLFYPWEDPDKNFIGRIFLRHDSLHGMIFANYPPPAESIRWRWLCPRHGSHPTTVSAFAQYAPFPGS